jgi:nucleoside-diphosphate-sugar epimerase
MELISRITNKKEPALTVYGVGTLTKSFTMDISKANELLGYNPSHSIDDAIEEFVQWYKIHEEH